MDKIHNGYENIWKSKGPKSTAIEWFRSTRHKTEEEEEEEEVSEDFKHTRRNKSNMILNTSLRKDESIHPDDLEVLQEIGSDIRIIW